MNPAPRTLRWTMAEIAAATGGTLIAGDPSTTIAAVTQDSREISRDVPTLFVPIVAERDGHLFIPGAIDSGAVATLTARELPSDIGDVAIVAVDDTLEALQALGTAARRRFEDAEVIGITGSVGKTSTKDMLAAVMAAQRTTHANARSFNNEMGVPLTLLGAPVDADVLVIEMGARGIGHIRSLCEIARPTVGVITAVGQAHTSEFGSIAAVAQAKGELAEAIDADGIVVLNVANPYVAAMADRTAARVVTYAGPSAPDVAADVTATGVVLDDELVPSFTLTTSQGTAAVTLGAKGLHQIDNALAAASVGLALGVDIDDIANALATVRLSPLRMDLVTAVSGAKVLNDAYNANPVSTEAALRSLAALPAQRRVAVLGVMAELGEDGAAEHERMSQIADELDIALISVAAPDYNAALHGGVAVSDVDEAIAALGALDRTTAVLVKGSRVAALERVVAALT